MRPPTYCDFCGRGADEAFWLVAGASALICDECIDLAATIIAEKRMSQADRDRIFADTVGWTGPLP